MGPDQKSGGDMRGKGISSYSLSFGLELGRDEIVSKHELIGGYSLPRLENFKRGTGRSLQYLINDPRLEVGMSRGSFEGIMETVGAQIPESGGLLLGPVGSRDISDFYFDSTAIRTGSTYSPDTGTLNRKMAEEWSPMGMDMKGMVHSHPVHAYSLSNGDLIYVRRLLQANSNMDRFVAPIVIPDREQFNAFVVLPEYPFAYFSAKLNLLD